MKRAAKIDPSPWIDCDFLHWLTTMRGDERFLHISAELCLRLQRAGFP